tara:strand:+ start:589 stop:1488 length:900 start_codon:yes stop_codon:yes gene_type:complete
MGGTRFIGKSLVRALVKKGYEITLFTRGKLPVPDHVEHLKGDRQNDSDLKSLSRRKFDIIIDSSGRTLEDTKKVISYTGKPNYRFIYISSAGIYQTSEVLPIKEDYLIDSKSRHIGKAHTEEWLRKENIPYTIFRPTYIYGPGNYNPIEKWFFDRITNNQPVPLPGRGETITQLGHVEDLTNAIMLSIDSPKAENKIYNCSGKNGVTFKGLIRNAAIACQIDPSRVELKSFDPSQLESKARKAFPLRLEHFFTDISLLENDLNWKQKFDLQEGLKDSFKNDYSFEIKEDIDFSNDLNLF